MVSCRTFPIEVITILLCCPLLTMFLLLLIYKLKRLQVGWHILSFMFGLVGSYVRFYRSLIIFLYYVSVVSVLYKFLRFILNQSKVRKVLVGYISSTVICTRCTLFYETGFHVRGGGNTSEPLIISEESFLIILSFYEIVSKYFECGQSHFFPCICFLFTDPMTGTDHPYPSVLEKVDDQSQRQLYKYLLSFLE